MIDSDACPPAFPPGTIEAFLRFCEGEWMSLRSQFELADQAHGETGDEWHSSERGDLVVVYLPMRDGPGGLSMGPKAAPGRRLIFAADGRFNSQDGDAYHEGRWQLWPDGSLELLLDRGDVEVRELIWYTKPNLRLRSIVDQRSDGSQGRASFSSEIRRISSPA